MNSSPRSIVGKAAWVLALCFFCSTSWAQSDATPKSHRWVVYGGIGPNVYFNDLEFRPDLVKPVNYSFVARLMWEPEYFISLGIETGYNQLYRWSAYHPVPGIVNIVNSVVPIQGVVSMKFSEHIYANFNLGFGLLFNNVTTENAGNFDASVMSLGDFAAAVGYRKNINDRVTLGGELRGYYSGKLQDRNIALVFMAGYRIW